jgi:hypothetical protein
VLSGVISQVKKWEDVFVEIKQEHLLTFIELYERKFGQRLTTTEAQPKLLMLLEYVSICLKPINKNDITDMPD